MKKVNWQIHSNINGISLLHRRSENSVSWKQDGNLSSRNGIDSYCFRSRKPEHYTWKKRMLLTYWILELLQHLMRRKILRWILRWVRLWIILWSWVITISWVEQGLSNEKSGCKPRLISPDRLTPIFLWRRSKLWFIYGKLTRLQQHRDTLLHHPFWERKHLWFLLAFSGKTHISRKLDLHKVLLSISFRSFEFYDSMKWCISINCSVIELWKDTTVYSPTLGTA